MSPHSDVILQRLVDERDIRDLLSRYCRAVDRCDKDLLRSLYHDDAFEEHGGYFGPADGFIQFAIDTMTWMECGSHQITNVIIELDGDVANAESCFISVAANGTDPEGAAIDLLITGRYIDRFERRDKSSWKIAHRLVIFDTNHTLPASGKWKGALYSDFAPRGQKDKSDALYTRYPLTEKPAV